jgi:hypothetical protein
MTLSMFRMSVCEKPRGEGDLLLTTMHAANRAIANAPNELGAHDDPSLILCIACTYELTPRAVRQEFRAQPAFLR